MRVRKRVKCLPSRSTPSHSPSTKRRRANTKFAPYLLSWKANKIWQMRKCSLLAFQCNTEKYASNRIFEKCVLSCILMKTQDNAQGSSRKTEVAKFPPSRSLRTWKDLVLHICTFFARSLSRTSEPFLCHSLTVSLESLKASVKGSSFTTRLVCRWEGKLSQVIVNYTM